MENKTARDPRFAENAARNRRYLDSIRFGGKKKYEIVDIDGNPIKTIVEGKQASDGVDWKAIGRAAR